MHRRRTVRNSTILVHKFRLAMAVFKIDMRKCEINNFNECRVTMWLWRTVPIVQLLIGTFGNIFNVLILSRQRMRKYSTTVYLIFLAVTDLTILWTLPFPKMLQYGFQVNVKSKYELICRSLPWLNYSIGGYSVWLLVPFTFEGIILIRWPVYARTTLSHRKSFVVASALFIMTTTLTSHLLFGFQIQLIPINGTNDTSLESVCNFASTSFMDFYNSTWTWTISLLLTM